MRRLPLECRRRCARRRARGSRRNESPTRTRDGGEVRGRREAHRLLYLILKENYAQRAVIKLGPPPPEVAALVLHREEDEHAHEGRAGVQRRREDVVVPLPPPLVVAKDEEVEDGAGEEPARYVGGRGRRHSGEAVGDDGDVDEADPLLLREAPAQGPDRHGKQRADEEQPHQVPVEPAMAEEASGADEAPYDGGVEGNPVLGAGPGAVRVKRLDVAYVLDALQHPPGHSEVYDSGDQSPDQLHGSRICSATERY
ncbi:unnamed protein product [Spirodela intermedia]|uniref:Uncharacterized protein n=1 Tax=Spirodela intermedia TaxID=51605 RepID=A0A7I8IJH9_SPIIN|nr:unnamed protein product [Spirodela intermedia]CAA6657308.1 unnamed protein product [Spirodela intermedia]